MRAFVAAVALAIALTALCGCSRTEGQNIQAASLPASNPAPPPPAREIRLTGIVEAVHSSKVGVPQIAGQSNQVTLVRLIPNGSRVEKGDLIAQFDTIQQVDQALQAKAKYDDLGHQAEQKAAQNRADAEKRKSDLTQAEADLRKATLELDKGPILAEIARKQNELKAQQARAHVESLQKSNAFHDKSDAAALRILELQRDRQKTALDRAQTNIDRLTMRAPIAGMIAHQNVYRGNFYGHPQEGDQLYRGQSLVSIFDPSEMQVRCSVGEPDGAALVAGLKAKVVLDAYPDLSLPAHFEFASPMASSALGSPIKTFTAVFKLDKVDARLMPDLSAAVVIEPGPGRQPASLAREGGPGPRK